MSDRFQFPDLRQEADRFVSHVGQTCNHLRTEASKLESRTRHVFQSAIAHTNTLFSFDRAFRPPNPLTHVHKFAVISFGKLFNREEAKKKKCKLSQLSLEKLTTREVLKRLTPEQRKHLDQMVIWNILHKKNYNHKGRKLTAKELMKSINEEFLRLERSVDVNTFQDIDKQYDYLELLEALPANYIRKDAPKQQLPRREERKLELTRITAGVCDKGLFGGKQFSFGIFAREHDLARHMIRWTKSDPKKASRDDEFFGDLMKVCREVELTLMVVPYKHLSIRKLQWEYSKKLGNTMHDLFGIDHGWQPLVDFVSLFDVNRIASSEWVEGSKVLPDTQLFFTTIRNGNLFVDAINPGPIKDQKTTLIGASLNPLIATAVFSLFLGKKPIDREAKELFVKSVIHLADGKPADPPNVDWRTFDEENLIDKNEIPVEERFSVKRGSLQTDTGVSEE
eukprot:g6794.t1